LFDWERLTETGVFLIFMVIIRINLIRLMLLRSICSVKFGWRSGILWLSACCVVEANEQEIEKKGMSIGVGSAHSIYSFTHPFLYVFLLFPLRNLAPCTGRWSLSVMITRAKNPKQQLLGIVLIISNSNTGKIMVNSVVACGSIRIHISKERERDQ
jgi:hypothetical protein